MTISQKRKEKIRHRAKYHCEYCKRSEEIMATNFEVDHIVPVSKGGTDDDDNLACACRDCNAHKSNREMCLDPETNNDTPIFNPRNQVWENHFQWSQDGIQLTGLSIIGRAIINCLYLNNERLQNARKGWRKLGWTPPQN